MYVFEEALCQRTLYAQHYVRTLERQPLSNIFLN